MLFEHLGHDHLGLASFQNGHKPKAARKLLWYPHMHGSELDGLSRLHAQGRFSRSLS
jgi:hypothetical protein